MYMVIHTCMVCIYVGCRFRGRDQCQKRAVSLERALGYEDRHLGGYRRIYPREGGEGGEGYDQYLQHSCSLFQETAASRARGKCTRWGVDCPHCYTHTPHTLTHRQTNRDITNFFPF